MLCFMNSQQPCFVIRKVVVYQHLAVVNNALTNMMSMINHNGH